MNVLPAPLIIASEPLKSKDGFVHLVAKNRLRWMIMKRGFKGVQSHSRLLPRSACYPARSEVCLEIPLYLGQPIIFSQCQHNVSGSTCNAWITGNYSFCYDCPSNPNRYGNPDCIWPDVTILDSKHRPVYTFEVIGSSPIKPKTPALSPHSSATMAIRISSGQL